MRSPQQQGRRFEHELELVHKLRAVPGSGSGPVRLGDLEDDDRVIEVKLVTAGSKSHSINGARVLDLLRHAEGSGREAEYWVYFADQDLHLRAEIRRGKP